MTSLRPRPPRVSAALLVLSALRCAGALRPSLRFPGLQAASFQHPVDEQALARLRDTAPLQLASRLLQPVVGAMARSERGFARVVKLRVDGRKSTNSRVDGHGTKQSDRASSNSTTQNRTMRARPDCRGG